MQKTNILIIYLSKPGPDEFDMILRIDPEDVEIGRIKFLVDQLAEGAHLGKLLRSQIVIGTKVKES